MTLEQVNKVREALLNYSQADSDGVMVTVSRQAVEYAAQIIEAALSASAQSDVEKDAVATIHSYDAETGEMWVKAKKHLSIQLGEVLYLNKAERNGGMEIIKRGNAPSISRYFSEQEFEGVVLSVDEKNKTFFARLVDETNNQPDEEAELSFSEISPDDRPLIVPGALFSWNIGRSERSGQVQRLSEIRFRRVFRFRENSISIASLLAERNGE